MAALLHPAEAGAIFQPQDAAVFPPAQPQPSTCGNARTDPDRLIPITPAAEAVKAAKHTKFLEQLSWAQSGKPHEIAAAIYMDDSGELEFGEAKTPRPKPPVVDWVNETLATPHSLPVGELRAATPNKKRLVGFIHSHPNWKGTLAPVVPTAADVVAAAKIARHSGRGIGLAATFNQPTAGSGSVTTIEVIGVTSKETARAIIRESRQNDFAGSESASGLVEKYDLVHATFRNSNVPAARLPTSTL